MSTLVGALRISIRVAPAFYGRRVLLGSPGMSAGRSRGAQIHSWCIHRPAFHPREAAVTIEFDFVQPIVGRKWFAKRLLADVPGVLFVGDLPARAELFTQAVEALKLEGVVAKQRGSLYAPGVRSPHWVKIKRAGWQEGRAWRNN